MLGLWVLPTRLAHLPGVGNLQASGLFDEMNVLSECLGASLCPGVHSRAVGPQEEVGVIPRSWRVLTPASWTLMKVGLGALSLHSQPQGSAQATVRTLARVRWLPTAPDNVAALSTLRGQSVRWTSAAVVSKVPAWSISRPETSLASEWGLLPHSALAQLYVPVLPPRALAQLYAPVLPAPAPDFDSFLQLH